MSLFEEIITSQTLRSYFKEIEEKQLNNFKEDLIQNYKLEYGFYD